MEWNLIFFVNSVLLGVGLAMDAFSVSIANALSESSMRKSRMCFIAGVYAFFQFAMPMIGWICVSTVAKMFSVFEMFIPWIAFILLGYIGGKMLYEGIFDKEEEENIGIGIQGLIVQGIATSIDALSVGFTISHYTWYEAFIACLLIGSVTFIISFAGLGIGKKAGTKLAGKAEILGGIILISIGLEILIKSLI